MEEQQQTVKQTRIENIYMNHYKKLLIIPLILLIFSLTVLGLQYYRTGSFIYKDVTLKGGISATITTDQELNINELSLKLKEKFPSSDVSIRKLTDITTGRSLGVLIEISDIKATDLESALEDLLNFKLDDQNFSIEEVGSALGASFFKEMIRAIIFAFIFMAIVVFIIFRKFIPSIAVILSVLVEMLTALAIIDLLHIKVSTAGIAALLMVMGYSIDTDILLTTRILKRTSGTLFERFKGSVKTGVMMTTTTITALSIGYIITNSAVIKQMFLIILIALFVDMITTWVMNSSLLIWYCKKHNIK